MLGRVFLLLPVLAQSSGTSFLQASKGFHSAGSASNCVGAHEVPHLALLGTIKFPLCSSWRAGIKFVKQYGRDPLVGVPNRTKKGGKIRLGAVRLQGSDPMRSAAADPATNPAAGSMGQSVGGWPPEPGTEISAPAPCSDSGGLGDALLAGLDRGVGGPAEDSSCAQREHAPGRSQSTHAPRGRSSNPGEGLAGAAAAAAASSGSGNHGWWSHAPRRRPGPPTRRKGGRALGRPPGAPAGAAGLNGDEKVTCVLTGRPGSMADRNGSRDQSQALPAPAGAGVRDRAGIRRGRGPGHMGGQGAVAPLRSERDAKKRTDARSKEGPKRQKQRAQPVLVF